MSIEELLLDFKKDCFERLPVVTHSGIFHMDEICANCLLRFVDLWDGTLYRTRDTNLINKKIGNAYIIDVGGVYNPDNKQFDHHQSSFDEYFSKYAEGCGIKMSSCGLIYLYLGPLVMITAIDLMKDKEEYSNLITKALAHGIITQKVLYNMCDSFYNRYIISVDAIDYGMISTYKTPAGKILRSPWDTNNEVRLHNIHKDSADFDKKQDKRYLKMMDSCSEKLELMLFDFIQDFIELEFNIPKLTSIIKGTSREYGEIIKYKGCEILCLDIHIKYSKIAKRLMSKDWVFTILPSNNKKSFWYVRIVAHCDFRIIPENHEDCPKLRDTEFINSTFLAGFKTKSKAIEIAKKSIIYNIYGTSTSSI